MDDTRSPVGKFKAFVDSIAKKGMNGTGDAAPYVPFEQIKAYWSSKRIETMLQLSTDIPTSESMTISRSYLRIFSILVLLGKAKYQSEFLRRRVEDSNLPIDLHWPYKCNISDFTDDVIPQFYEQQWLFCPVVLATGCPMHQKELKPREVLPFSNKRFVRRDDAATWSSIDIMDFLEDHQANRSNYVLLKEYSGDYDRYHQESKILSALEKRHTRAMVHYYGSYSQRETSAILLECTGTHSLNELFDQKPPSLIYDIAAFWTSLAHVTEALSCIHHQNISEQGVGSKLHSMHYDIKPENIIWLRERSPEEPYCFKLSIDGYTDAIQRTCSKFSAPLEPGIYGSSKSQILAYLSDSEIDAPEYARLISAINGSNDQKIVDEQFRKSDIWALGCTLSEAAVWCTLGPEGLFLYREERRKEISSKAWRNWAFRDGKRLLEVIYRAHDKVNSGIKAYDTITPKILDILEHHIQLIDNNSRLSAKELYRMMMEIFTEPPAIKQGLDYGQRENHLIGTRLTPGDLVDGMENDNCLDTKDYNRRMGPLDLKNDSEDSVTYKHTKVAENLPAADYTIGWVCMRYADMAAARAMLDAVHDNIPLEPSDGNTYILGNIKEYNIVVVGLPRTNCGMNSTARTAADMYRSFPSIRACLLVGTGSGIPNKGGAIQLGDVIISQRVVKFDPTKILPNGRLARSGIPLRPFLEFTTAMRDMAYDSENETAFNIDEIFRNNQAMGGIYIDQDFLLGSPCKDNKRTCHSHLWKASILKSLMNRRDTKPRVHCGQVASGDQAIDTTTKWNQLTVEPGIVCFEVGATELLENFPGLIIRGISGFLGSLNDGSWQEYAAAAAAACAKLLLFRMAKTNTGLPRAVSRHPSITYVLPEDDPASERWAPSQDGQATLLNLRRSKRLDTGSLHMDSGPEKTFNWLFQNSTFRSWVGGQNPNHSVLWVKGKPGCGKTTLMKYMYQDANRLMRDNVNVVAFFYAPGGNGNEQLPKRMYQSLLVQLLQTSPELRSVPGFLNSYRMQPNGGPAWDIEGLRDLLSLAITKIKHQRLMLILDALDECSEHDFQDTVDYFAYLGRRAIETETKLHICFSSRPHPYVSIRFGLYMTLESEKGHQQELEKYLVRGYTIRFGAGWLIKEIQDELIFKSSGTFLWVSLALDTLHRESQNSHILAMKKRLQEIPAGLNELFEDILNRDNEDVDDLLICLQWILYAKRPLSREEFYYTLKFSLDPIHLVEWDSSRMSVESMNRFVLDSSRCLAEVTKSGEGTTVRLIHASVREYLIKNDGLRKRWPVLGEDISSQSHERLKQLCYRYIELLTSKYYLRGENLSGTSKDGELKWGAPEDFPFLEYATGYVLHHANEAAASIPQSDFLRRLAFSDWVKLGLPRSNQVPRHRADISLLYILARNNLTRLLKIHISETTIEGKQFQLALLAALTRGNEAAVKALLEAEDIRLPSLNITRPDLEDAHDRCEDEGQTPLHWAIVKADATLCKLILRSRGADVNLENAYGQTPLSLAVKLGYSNIVRLLLGHGARVDIGDIHDERPLSYAAKSGQVLMVQFLIECGADIEAKDHSGRTALSHAAIYGHDLVVKILVTMNAEFDDRDYTGRTPLSHAAENGRDLVAWQLVEYGAGLNPIDQAIQTPILYATESGHQFIVRLLMSIYRNRSGSCKGHESII